MELEKKLYRYFGYYTFRSQQKEIVSAILAGKDVFALLPTGAGKSICFQLPAVLLPGLTIVVSPLIALMQDQVDNLLKKGILATYISSTLSHTEVASRIDLLRLEKYKLLYVSPERLKQKKFIELCQKLPIKLMVVDEAHCISAWGHDFRPDYWNIQEFMKQLPHRPVLAAFTATATTKTVAEIILNLELHDPSIFRQSFKRDNLHISVIHTNSYQEQELSVMLLVLKHKNQSGIIYTATHESAENLTQLLKKIMNSDEVSYYHGDLPAKERSYVQKLFVSGKIKVIVATSAFGMGIDKSDIRYVIHHQFPGSIEAYYQEIGRGGRDGELANCYLIYNEKNQNIHTFLAKSSGTKQQWRHKIISMRIMQEYSKNSKCRMAFLLRYFNEKKLERCMNCDCCRKNNDIISQQHAKRLKNLKIYRALLQKKFALNNPAEVATDNQLLQLTVFNPTTTKGITELVGFGQGWCQQWLEYFSPENGKIPITN